MNHKIIAVVTVVDIILQRASEEIKEGIKNSIK